MEKGGEVGNMNSQEPKKGRNKELLITCGSTKKTITIDKW